MTFSNETIVKLADMMISYHAHSFRARRVPFFNGEITPPIVDELGNMRKRIGNEYEPEEKMFNAVGLHEIVTRNKVEIRALATIAKSAENARPYAEKAGILMDELSSTIYLLELLNG